MREPLIKNVINEKLIINFKTLQYFKGLISNHFGIKIGYFTS